MDACRPAKHVPADASVCGDWFVQDETDDDATVHTDADGETVTRQEKVDGMGASSEAERAVRRDARACMANPVPGMMKLRLLERLADIACVRAHSETRMGDSPLRPPSSLV